MLIYMRLKLFGATVSKCELWCCESWAPRAAELAALKSAQNKMLRRIVGSGRAPDETWLEWIQRATTRANNFARRASTPRWETEHYRMKWNWAGNVARRSEESWLKRTTTWRDSCGQSLVDAVGLNRPLSPSTRPCVRWEDAMRRFCTSKSLDPWTVLAQSKPEWDKHATICSG